MAAYQYLKPSIHSMKGNCAQCLMAMGPLADTWAETRMVDGSNLPVEAAPVDLGDVPL
jgi:hypothetical protein